MQPIEETIESLAFNAAMEFAAALACTEKNPKAFGEAVRAAFEAVKHAQEEAASTK
jgi:hypothetical protein